MLPLRVLERGLRVRQLPCDAVAVGDFLREPDFDLTVALGRVRGGQPLDRGALFRLLQRSDGVGQTEFEDLVRDLAMPPEFNLETMQTFIDWDRKVPFEVIRGEGECAV